MLHKWLPHGTNNVPSGFNLTVSFFNPTSPLCLFVGLQELGFSYVEMNASCTRSKNSLKEVVSESLNNTSIESFYKGDPSFHFCFSMFPPVNTFGPTLAFIDVLVSEENKLEGFNCETAIGSLLCLIWLHNSIAKKNSWLLASCDGLC